MVDKISADGVYGGVVPISNLEGKNWLPSKQVKESSVQGSPGKGCRGVAGTRTRTKEGVSGSQLLDALLKRKYQSVLGVLERGHVLQAKCWILSLEKQEAVEDSK